MKQSGGLSLNYLPQEPELRQQLWSSIQRYKTKLQRKLQIQTQKHPIDRNLLQKLQNKIEKLNLRLELISSCSELSQLRIDHLQKIFQHYCTHIFKIGNHMTFQRLQYEKVHMTMDRFFLFLRDFQMTMMETDKGNLETDRGNIETDKGTIEIDQGKKETDKDKMETGKGKMKTSKGKMEEVVEKPLIITMFKKISSNSRDLSFEEFIQAIDKLAVLYYNEKQVFYEKKQKIRIQKQKRKQQFEKRKAQRIKKRRVSDQQQPPHENQDSQNINQQKDQQEQEDDKQHPEAQENDGLIQDMINDKNLEDPNEEVNQISKRYAFQEEESQESLCISNPQVDNHNDELYLILTDEQKIERYYQQIIQIDSLNDFRSKLTNLNLNIFQKKDKKKASDYKTIDVSHIKKRNVGEENKRVDELRKKMEQKKQKKKTAPIPKPKDDGAWVKAQEEKKKKRQLKKQRQQNAKKKSKAESDEALQKKLDSQKKGKQKDKQKQVYNQNKIDWNMIGKVSIDQLKLKQFNPHSLFGKDADDTIFLDEYEGGRSRVTSGMDMRERNSIAIVQQMKKRVGEIEKREQQNVKELENLSRKMAIKTRFS